MFPDFSNKDKVYIHRSLLNTSFNILSFGKSKIWNPTNSYYFSKNKKHCLMKQKRKPVLSSCIWTCVCIGNQMISRAIWNTIKISDYLLIIYMKKFLFMLIDEKISRWLSRRNALVSCKQGKIVPWICHIQGVCLILKQKISLAMCEFLFRDFPVNQFNFKFLHSIST